MPSYGSNTYSNISAFVNSIYEDAFAVAREQNLAAGIVKVFTDQNGMALRKSQGYSAASINQVAETDDLASQVFTPTAIGTLTPYEYGGQFLLTDQRIDSDPFGVRDDASIELGGAMAAKIDTSVFNNLSSFTGGTVGASGSAISWTYLENALALLRAQFAPLPYRAVMHPYQWTILARAASVAGSSATNAGVALPDEVNRNFWVGHVLGVDIYITANVQTSGNDAYFGVFSAPALGLDIRRAARLEVERDASRRAWELNMTAVFGAGVWRPKFGVYGICSLTTPS
jgi:hypothetical protein